MTNRERFVRVLTGRDVDRVPFVKVFGGDNSVLPHWEQEHPGIGQEIDRLLQFDCPYRGWSITPVNFDLSKREVVSVETEPDGRRTTRLSDGTVQVAIPHGDYHAHIVEYPVKDRNDWESVRDLHLDPEDQSRFPSDWDDYVASINGRDFPLQLTHRGVYGMARNLLGDEALAYLFYDDPALVREIMDYYTDMAIRLWKKMTPRIDFDLVEFWEDMASKNGSLISPRMFREYMLPNYRKVADFASENGIEVLLVDSDGYIEDLAPLMVEGGVNAMYPFEVLAGNDVARVLDALPAMSAIGGLDKDCMSRGRSAMDAELEKARGLIRGGRYIPGPDHFVLSNVSLADYVYFMQRLRDIVMNTGEQ